MKKLLLPLIFVNSFAFSQSWQACITPTDVHVNSLIVYNGKLIIGGYGSRGEYILSYDGLSYDTIGITSPYPDIWTMAIHNNDLYIGGSFSSVNGVNALNIARYDGASWYAVGTSIFNPGSSVLRLFSFDSLLFAGGDFTSINSIPFPRVAVWNGLSWMQAGNGFDEFVSSFGVYQNNLYAGGGFSASGNDSMNRIARWDGAMWQALADGGIDEDITTSGYSYVNAIKEFNGKLFAGGYFIKAGSIASGNIAVWDGNMWLPCPFSFNSFVSSLSIYNNKLFIGGFFYYQPPPVHSACSWDGFALDDLQGGILAAWNSKTVWASEVFNNKIYFGGNMLGNYQGNIFSEGLIAWDEFNTTSASFFSSPNPIVYPNPSDGNFSVLNEQIKGEYTLSIYDLSGKLIVQEAYDGMVRNNINVNLNAGLYNLHLTADGESKNCKLIIIR